ncbi:hypothetical protein LY76DRAFT_638193 [Colletotrichum caudatum]|nr:hypothetical protein LY76DRAFT_638193 [Colletotrichum caudatum]
MAVMPLDAPTPKFDQACPLALCGLWFTAGKPSVKSRTRVEPPWETAPECEVDSIGENGPDLSTNLNQLWFGLYAVIYCKAYSTAPLMIELIANGMFEAWLYNLVHGVMLSDSIEEHIVENSPADRCTKDGDNAFGPTDSNGVEVITILVNKSP